MTRALMSACIYYESTMECCFSEKRPQESRGHRPLSWLAVCWYSKGMPFPDDQVISPLELDCNKDVCNHNLHKHRLLRQRCPIIPCRSRGIHIENCDHFYLQARPMAHMISGLGPCNYAITQWYATPWTRTRLWPTATVWRRHMLMLIYQCMCRSYIA